MKFFPLLAASLATSVTARSLQPLDQHAISFQKEEPITQEQYLIELSPGETRWVSEEEKWELKRVCLI